MNALLVGDVHVVVEELQECERLFDLIEESAARLQPDYVVFMGDQYHQHSVVRVEVLEFLTRRFERIVRALEPSHAGGNRIVALVGNHDQPGGEGSSAHAMLAHAHQRGVTVVGDALGWGRGGAAFLPYMRSEERFYEACRQRAEMGFTGLVCHQSFKGAYYENGQVIGGDVYMPDGFDLEKVPMKWVISGHIHKPQTTGKLWYVGAPRWRSASDANESRAIHFVEFAADGYSVRESIDTGTACRQIRHVVLTPDAPSFEADGDHRWLVDVKGPVDFVEERKNALSGLGFRIRTYPDRVEAISIKESDGVDVAFSKHLEVYTPKFGTARTRLAEMAKERVSLCRR